MQSGMKGFSGLRPGSGPNTLTKLLLAAAVVAARGGAVHLASEPGAPSPFDPRRPPERELEMSVADGFTFAAVGDCIMSRPLSPMLKKDEGFAAVVKILREAHATFGNFENTAIDIRTFGGYPYPDKGDWALVAEPEVAKDLKALGFDLLSRANNHALDWGVEGMRDTGQRLDEAGLVHAGAGEDRGRARAARYLETEMGRVALVSMASSFREGSQAMPPYGLAPGRPGLNALRITRYTSVTSEVMRDLRNIKSAFEKSSSACDSGPMALDVGAPRDRSEDGRKELTLFGQKFRLGEQSGYQYVMDPADLSEILRSIREGKQHADFLIATIHAHEWGPGCGEPGDFLPALARAAIDAGADAFVGHGEHRLGPIEIYKGKPIFYSLANFFWSDIQEPMPAEIYEANRDLVAKALGEVSRATDADLTALLNATSFNNEEYFQSVVAVSRFEKGRLVEIRLYPVDLGYGMRLTKSGIPRLASLEVGRAILERLQRLSQPYGTTIGVEQNVGMIRPR